MEMKGIFRKTGMFFGSFLLAFSITLPNVAVYVAGGTRPVAAEKAKKAIKTEKGKIERKKEQKKSSHPNYVNLT